MSAKTSPDELGVWFAERSRPPARANSPSRFAAIILPACPVPTPRNPANLRSWRVIIIRGRGEYLGSVEAPDRERAVAVAAKLFDLDDDQRSRLLIRERQ